MWMQVLAEAGLEARALDADHIQLNTRAGAMTVRVLHRAHPLSPSQLPAATEPDSLLHVPRISRKAMQAAAADGWSVVTDDGRLSLLLPDGTRIHREPAGAMAPRDRRAPGPAQFGRFAIVRRLLEDGPQHQARLAKATGIGQPRVSRILMPLRERGLLTRTDLGWAPADWELLCDWFLATYPGPGGVATYWYSLDPVPMAALAAVAACAKVGRAALSGDAAADLVLPWRRPRQAVVYAERGADIGKAGFTSSVSAADATLVLVVAKDPGVWPPHAWTPLPAHPGVELADPVQILHDLHTASGPDADQAAQRWRSALGAGTLPRFPRGLEAP
jgi:hypothetical protein